MFGITNASKGVQEPATKADIEDAKQAAITTSENYTDNHKGYKIVTNTNGTAASNSWNTELRMTEMTTSTLSITIPANVSDMEETCEFRVVLGFATSVSSPAVTFTANSGQSIKWPDDIPDWVAGSIYEISFSPLYTKSGTTYVVGYAKATEIQ